MYAQMRTIFILKLFFTAAVLLISQDAWAAAKGILIYSDYGGSAPYLIEFETISWKNGQIGVVKKPSGQSDTFQNSTVHCIIYLDRAYYETLSRIPGIQLMRIPVRTKERVVDIDPQNISSAEDGSRVAADVALLKAVCQAYPCSMPKLHGPLATLGDQLRRFNLGERKINARWLSAAEVEERKKNLENASPKGPGQSFTTKSGTRYEGVQIISIGDGDFSVESDSGVSKIRFDELPDSLTGVPGAVAEVVKEKKEKALQAAREAEGKKRAEAELAAHRAEEARLAEVEKLARESDIKEKVKNALEKSRERQQKKHQGSNPSSYLSADRTVVDIFIDLPTSESMRYSEQIPGSGFTDSYEVRLIGQSLSYIKSLAASKGITGLTVDRIAISNAILLGRAGNDKRTAVTFAVAVVTDAFTAYSALQEKRRIATKQGVFLTDTSLEEIASTRVNGLSNFLQEDPSVVAASLLREHWGLSDANKQTLDRLQDEYRQANNLPGRQQARTNLHENIIQMSGLTSQRLVDLFGGGRGAAGAMNTLGLRELETTIRMLSASYDRKSLDDGIPRIIDAVVSKEDMASMGTNREDFSDFMEEFYDTLGVAEQQETIDALRRGDVKKAKEIVMQSEGWGSATKARDAFLHKLENLAAGKGGQPR